MLGLFTDDDAHTPSCWAIGSEATVIEAISADPITRASAMESEAAAWWWVTHARDDDRREHRVMRLRTGLDLLVMREAAQRVAGGSHARSESTTEWVPTLSELAALAGPPSTSVALTYIEIVLVDDAGVPVAGESYEVELPDGRVCTGKLDADGLARVDGVPVGPCVVRFPNCDRAEVDAA
ncbi:MAG: hypothetical protein IAG13_30290 [Deltaproteobacteria bacterium]|nr:hypothetical protein [Nannocystaceae bacterium]